MRNNVILMQAMQIIVWSNADVLSKPFLESTLNITWITTWYAIFTDENAIDYVFC